MEDPIYNQIGINYSKYRKADPRLVEAILDCLDVPKKSTIGDIGAGTGNYSRAIAKQDYLVKCIKPSDVMARQRKQHQNIEWLPGTAENIPLSTSSMDAVMVILAFHHFLNPEKAIAEMERVSKGKIVLLTFDPREIERPWIANYFPELWEDAFKFFPPLSKVANLIESVSKKSVTTHIFKLPHDLQDYFLAAGWRRPEIYLDPIIRSCMSGFAVANQTQVEEGVKELKQDLEIEEWENNYGFLKQQENMDVGYRFIVAN
jgi:ubiquinone/menaquinone biosynthesis C-methylase UbiE